MFFISYFFFEINWKEDIKEFKEVRQINLTPTLALLLGLPIPYSNLGIVIEEMFVNNHLDALHANFLQVFYLKII